MDVFKLRNELVGEYEEYMRGFVRIRDQRIQGAADTAFSSGELWPDPLIQLNPSFLPGATIDELVAAGTLHPECGRVFRAQKDQTPGGRPITLHTHQVAAIRAAKKNANYVLTTGTGSGKSLAYIVPIVDSIIRQNLKKGVQAIVVYPMNALANSQHGELEKFLRHGYSEGPYPVSFERYTGQEDDVTKRRIQGDPPNIILTNYIMLELMLTRPEESKSLMEAARGLKFLVLDELHTYRGRQGADVALLIRRLRDRLESPEMICVGTSATLSSAGTYEEQQAEIAHVATRLFGAEVKPEDVIGETLQRETPEFDASDPAAVQALRSRVESEDPPPSTYTEFIADPLSAWMESAFGLTADASGRLVRQTPSSIRGAHGAHLRLAEITGAAPERCAGKIEETFLAGYNCDPHPETGRKPFAFRLHQFLSRGDTVYASLEDETRRYLTVHGQQFVPGRREALLFPLVFCRECGQEFYCARKEETGEGEVNFEARAFDEMPVDKEEKKHYGYLFFCPEPTPWPDDESEVIERLPDDWSEEFRGRRRIRKSRETYVPEPFFVQPNGTTAPDGFRVHFIRFPFRFCPHCGVAYDAHQRNDFPKLAMLGSDGRSTATTVLCLSTILSLRTEPTLEDVARKLLSFTDNRQDASLQAGHFNDFLETALIRAAIYKALVEAGEVGIRPEELPLHVFRALNLPARFYLRDPNMKYAALENANAAFRDVLAYRIYRDLKRGWRILSPNLEQLGLLRIAYLSLEELCADPAEWADTHAALASAAPGKRAEILQVLLDFLRRELAVDVEVLNPQFHERLKRQTYNTLIDPWAVDEDEKLEYARVAYPYPQKKDNSREGIYLSGRGRFGKYLRASGRFPDHEESLSVQDAQTIIQDLFRVLTVAGLVRAVADPLEGEELPGFQVPANCLRWRAGDGTSPYVDPLRTLVASAEGARPSPFFQRFYKEVALTAKGIEAREHTAQVPPKIREEREKLFGAAQLPVLFCSPTMELGVDISELNVVNLRNVPPTPANYAQRSGRAGRSGQPALVFTYCALGSPHDQYFFKRPQDMVKGAVLTPRIELANEDLIQSHVQSIWLAETGKSLKGSLKDVLDVDGEEPTLKLRQEFRDAIDNPSIKDRAAARARRVLSTIQAELEESDWYTDSWLGEQVIQPIGRSFDQACDRWRRLYWSAVSQMREQNKIIESAARSQPDKQRAKNLRREAEGQLDLLVRSSGGIQSDFYSYRYFASEGFLPGYSFPRLPLAAYIPGRRVRHSRQDFLNRPRFLAISEFGPRAHIYHEGSRYEVNKVILPAREGEEIHTATAKLCPDCGYLHEINEDRSYDTCVLCEAELSNAMPNLFRLQNVSARRRERISSDEEERLRMGYEIRSAVRFADRGDRPSFRMAEVRDSRGKVRFTLRYGQAATIWRINCGWRRRKDYGSMGFMLDTERGFWQKKPEALEPTGGDGEAVSGRQRRVIPFVQDRKNALLLEPAEGLSEAVMASVQAALKQAIQIGYQLEDNELAAVPLPDSGRRNQILLYESAEGGAGVLRQLARNPDALARVAREGLALCHFDPETGADWGHSEGGSERCEAACYQCLLSYTNQPDHKLLDRFQARDWLILLRDATVVPSPGEVSLDSHLESLEAAAGSSLERRWLAFLQDRRRRLPDKAQPYIESCATRPDFSYDGGAPAAIYIDGPPHDYPDRQRRDAEQEECLLNASYIVIRFHHEADWDEVIRRYPSIFGGGGR